MAVERDPVTSGARFSHPDAMHMQYVGGGYRSALIRLTHLIFECVA
jgi:hypothetical protein